METTDVSSRKIKEYSKDYADYYPIVFSTIYGKVNNRDEAEDICQEVFMIYFQKYTDIENPRAWLYGTMTNVIKKYYNRKGKTETDIADMLDDVAMSFVNGFKDLRIMIEEAMTDLRNFDNEQDKMLFELIAVHNFSYRKAAKVMGYTFEQVRYRYKQSVEKLTEYFKNRGINSLEELLA